MRDKRTGRRKFGPSQREILERNNAADRLYAAMAGIEPQFQTVLPPKRSRAAPDEAVAEKGVLAEVGEYLKLAHQGLGLLIAVRQNSGAVDYVWFYKLLVSPQPMTIVDYWGLFRDGRPWALECKNRLWRKPSGERELRQQAFLQMIECVGGRAGFVRSADEARQVLI